MITTNRNVFLGIHITQSVKDALSKEVQKRRQPDGKPPDYSISLSLVGYELLKNALIQHGYADLVNDDVL